MSGRPKSQAERIQEIGLGPWLDEPVELDEFYPKPRVNPDLIMSTCCPRGGGGFWPVALGLVAVLVGLSALLAWWLS